MAQVQEIVDLVLQALAANAKTIDDLTEVLNVGESDFIELNGGRKISVNKLAELVGGSMAEVTHAELKALRDGGALVAGKQYRITDYVCTTVQEDTQSAGHQFDIIVTADDASTLNENARACLHDGDEYFAGCKLEAWKLKYCLDNDTERFVWATASPEHITLGEDIFYRKSELDGSNTDEGFEEYNYAWETPDTKVIYTKTLNNATDAYDIDGGETVQIIYTPVGKGVIYQMIDEWNNECPYDFKNIMFKRYFDEDAGYYKKGKSKENKWCYTFCMLDFYDGLAHDVTVEQEKYISDENLYCHNHHNKINSYYDEYAIYGDPTKGVYKLNDNVFVTDTGISAIEENYGEFYGFYSNTFGNDCYNNSFGNDCSNNSFGNDCSNNSFGNSCYYNTFGNKCSNNSFGNDCSNNSFGNDCYYNTFGTSAGAKSYYQYITFESGVKNTYLNCTATTSSSSYAQNVHVNSGVAGTSSGSRKTLTLATAGNAFLTTFGSSSDVKIDV